jgi:hypothetical protein
LSNQRKRKDLPGSVCAKPLMQLRHAIEEIKTSLDSLKHTSQEINWWIGEKWSVLENQKQSLQQSSAMFGDFAFDTRVSNQPSFTR